MDFSTGDAASGRKARDGVLELTLGCGSRAQSQRAGGEQRQEEEQASKEQAPRRSIGKIVCEVQVSFRCSALPSASSGFSSSDALRNLAPCRAHPMAGYELMVPPSPAAPTALTQAPRCVVHSMMPC